VDPITNFAISTVQAGSTIIGSAATPRTIALEAGDGAKFPGGDGTTLFDVILWPPATLPDVGNAEIVRVTRVGDTLTTAARAQQGTAALNTIAANWQVARNIFAADLNSLNRQQLAYAEATADVVISAITEATADSIVSAGAVTFDGLTPVVIDFFCATVTSAADGRIIFVLYDGSSSIGLLGETYRPAGSQNWTPIRLSRRLTPSGAKTYSVRAYRVNNNQTIKAGAGGVGAYVPAFIRISKAVQ
jgi:hypothetical protein